MHQTAVVRQACRFAGGEGGTKGQGMRSRPHLLAHSLLHPLLRSHACAAARTCCRVKGKTATEVNIAERVSSNMKAYFAKKNWKVRTCGVGPALTLAFFDACTRTHIHIHTHIHTHTHTLAQTHSHKHTHSLTFLRASRSCSTHSGPSNVSAWTMARKIQPSRPQPQVPVWSS